MQKPKIVYIAVDDDDYELPFAMGDTMRELAEEIGVSTWDIWNCVRNRGRSTTPSNHTYRVEKVRLASDMEDILDFGMDRDIYNITINAYV